MADIKVPVCRLCLEIICNNIFEPVSNLISALQCVLPNMDYNIVPDPVICGTCKETLHKSVRFKTACLDTEIYLRSLLTRRISLDEIFNRTCKNDLGQQKGGKGETCRLCLHRIEDELSSQLTALEYILEKCLPEVDLTVVKTPFVCSVCVEELQSYVNFTTFCSDVGDRIKNYFTTKDGKFGNGSLHDLLASSLKMEPNKDDHISSSNLTPGIKVELQDDYFVMKNSIKQEEIFIKDEIEDDAEMLQDGNGFGVNSITGVEKKPLRKTPHLMDHNYMRTQYPVSDSFLYLLHRYRNCHKGYAHRSKLMAKKIKAVKRSIRLLDKKVKFYQKIVMNKFEKLKAVTAILENLKKENLLSEDAYVALIACSKVAEDTALL